MVKKTQQVKELADKIENQEPGSSKQVSGCKNETASQRGHLHLLF